MKIRILAILLFFMPCVLHAQQLTNQTGFWNLHYYDEKDEVTKIIYEYAYIDENGRLHTESYGNNEAIIIGSNYVKNIGLKEGSNNAIKNISKGFSDDEFLVWQTDGVIIIKQDSALKKIYFPEGYVLFQHAENIIHACILTKGEKFYLTQFDGKRFLIRDLNSLSQTTEKITGASVRSYNNKTLITICFFNEVCRIYEFISLELIKDIGWHFGHLLNIIYNDSCLGITTTNNKIVFIKNDGNKLKSSVKNAYYFLEDINIGKSLIDIKGDVKTIYNLKDISLNHFGKIRMPGKITMFGADTLLGTTNYYVCTGNKLARTFPYIKEYPNVFNKANSVNIFTLSQDSRGRIWAGGYNGSISIIDKDNVQQLAHNNISITNGSITIGKKMYFFREGGKNVGQLLEFNEKGNYRILLEDITGFIMFASKKDIYLGTYFYKGLYKTDIASLAKGQPRWQITDSSNGMKLKNIVALTEDTLGRIWCGQAGISVYDTNTKKATTWLRNKNEINFNVRSLITDRWGTVWIGTVNKGLHYYDDYTKPAHPLSLQRFGHPFFNDDQKVGSMTIWGKWLVLGVQDKVCLIDLEQWHSNKKMIVRYLNPHEASLTGEVEQNIFLTDRRDSSIWFSTTDNLYQWDIRAWLSLPAYKVNPHIMLSGKNHADTTLQQSSKFFINPRQNSFNIRIWFQTKDNMPRYISTAFVKKGDLIMYENPSLKTKFSYTNLAPGHYLLYLRIFESDGTTSEYQYTIIVRKFLWQQWWFWLFISAMVLGTTIYFLNITRRKQLAIQEAKTKAAEMETYRAEQEKKLSDLRLSSLGSQFRPHFILNALNTIGAKMYKEPKSESVISRLGDSVNLIFNHARQQKFIHNFSIEWQLVKNVIDIHRLMYLEDLQVALPDEDKFDKVKNVQVPLGILQIPVENALLHGLNNRLTPPWKISIGIDEDDLYYKFTITDNGIGRKKAALLSNHTSHGTGLKNLMEIISMLNRQNNDKISIEFADEIYMDNNETYGTKTTINISKQFDYG